MSEHLPLSKPCRDDHPGAANRIAFRFKVNHGSAETLPEGYLELNAPLGFKFDFFCHNQVEVRRDLIFGSYYNADQYGVGSWEKAAHRLTLSPVRDTFR